MFPTTVLPAQTVELHDRPVEGEPARIEYDSHPKSGGAQIVVTYITVYLGYVVSSPDPLYTVAREVFEFERGDWQFRSYDSVKGLHLDDARRTVPLGI